MLASGSAGHTGSKTGECDGAEGTVLVLPPWLWCLSVSFYNPEKWHVGCPWVPLTAHSRRQLSR